jgi:hypothetical protein
LKQKPFGIEPQMARKILNRKELRAEAEAAESVAGDSKAKVKAKPKAAAPKRKSRKKAAAEVRLKALWGVFNQSLKRVAVFEYSERKKADQKAQDLSGSAKSPHFVQLVKEAVEE